MSDLNDRIRQQYAARNNEHLYSSGYADRAGLELQQELKKILEGKINAESTILEIGAGQGNNVEMLRECGFRDHNIFLNELLPDRAAMASERFPSVTIIEGNAIEAQFNREFDFIFQSTVFTSVLDDLSRNQLAAAMMRSLKRGGYIVWYDFIYNNPRNADVRKVTLNDVRTLFNGLKVIDHRKITLAPPVGRRVGKLYNLFNLPFLRSHILVLLQKP